MKQALTSIGTLLIIVSLALFMFTSPLILFTVIAGIGCVAAMLMYDDYKKLLWKKEQEEEEAKKNVVEVELYPVKEEEPKKEDTPTEADNSLEISN